MIDDSAFVPGPPVSLRATGSGPLDGLRFAAKDLFDVAGHVTGYGNPDWARTHPPAAATAPAIMALLEAGAALAGKTKTVELALGLTGENIWYGTPRNPRAPDRFPGGSSCGSASAVASGDVDFALGSDTGGSVRIPASYCGLFGIRPSHGAVSLAGACPLAPSLDTLGWFARGASLLRRVGEVLLPEGGAAATPVLLRLEESWARAEPAVAAALEPAMARIAAALGPIGSVRPFPCASDLLMEHMRAVQGQEAWAALGSWVQATQPAFSPAVAQRFSVARDTDPAMAAAGRATRRAFTARMRSLLAGGAVLVFPTSPSPATPLAATAEAQEATRLRTLGVTVLASLCGLPEVSLPVAEIGGAPLGLSLVAGYGQDRALLALAERVAAALDLP